MKGGKAGKWREEEKEGRNEHLFVEQMFIECFVPCSVITYSNKLDKTPSLWSLHKYGIYCQGVKGP